MFIRVEVVLHLCQPPLKLVQVREPCGSLARLRPRLSGLPSRLVIVVVQDDHQLVLVVRLLLRVPLSRLCPGEGGVRGSLPGPLSQSTVAAAAGLQSCVRDGGENLFCLTDRSLLTLRGFELIQINVVIEGNLLLLREETFLAETARLLQTASPAERFARLEVVTVRHCCCPVLGAVSAQFASFQY